MTEPKAPANRAARRAKKQVTAKTTFTMEWTGEELAFLRLLLTNATIQPAELKKICGGCQEKVEALIGPLPSQ